MSSYEKCYRWTENEGRLAARGGSRGGCTSFPPATFKNFFDEYIFSIISNLFDNNKPNVLHTHKSKMLEQNASHLAKHSELYKQHS